MEDSFKVGTFNLGVASFLVAKATVMRNRVCATVQSGYCLVVLASDNQVFIQALKGKVQVPREIQTLVEDTKAYHAYCNQVQVCHIFKKKNRQLWIA